MSSINKKQKELIEKRAAIKAALKRISLEYSDQIHSVSMGYTEKKGEMKYCLLFGLEKKKSIQELPKDKILPTSVNIPGVGRFETDVRETKVISLNQSTSESFDFWWQHPSTIEKDVEQPDGTTSTEQSWQKLYAYCESPDNTLNNIKLRPLKSGCVISSELTTPSIGTLGYFVVDKDDKTLCALTNAHVVLNNQFIVSARKGQFNEEVIGKKVYQGLASTIEQWSDDEHIGCIKSFWPLGIAGTTPVATAYRSSEIPMDAALIALKPDVVSKDSWQLAGASNHLGDTPPPIVSPIDFSYFALDSLYFGYAKDVGGGAYDEPQMSFSGRTSGFRDGVDPKFRLLGPMSSIKMHVPNGADQEEIWIHGAFGVAVQPWEWRELNTDINGNVFPKGSFFCQNTILPGDSGSVLFAKTKSVSGITQEIKTEEGKLLQEYINDYAANNDGAVMTISEAKDLHQKYWVLYNDLKANGGFEEQQHLFPSFFENRQITSVSWVESRSFDEEETWKAVGLFFAAETVLDGTTLSALFFPMDEVAEMLNIESWDGNKNNVNFNYSDQGDLTINKIKARGVRDGVRHQVGEGDTKQVFHTSGTSKHANNTDDLIIKELGFGISRTDFPYQENIDFGNFLSFQDFSVQVDNENSIEGINPDRYPVWLKLENLNIDMSSLPVEYADLEHGALHLDAFLMKNDAKDDFLQNYQTKKSWNNDASLPADKNIYGKFEIFNIKGLPSNSDSVDPIRNFFSEIYDGKSEFYGKSVKLLNGGIPIDWTESEPNGRGGLKNQKITDVNSLFSTLPWIVSDDGTGRNGYYADPENISTWVLDNLKLVFVLWKEDASERIRSSFHVKNLADRQRAQYLLGVSDYGQVSNDKIETYEVDLFAEDESIDPTKRGKQMVLEIDTGLLWGYNINASVVATGGQYALSEDPTTPLANINSASQYSDGVDDEGQQSARNDSPIVIYSETSQIKIDWSQAPEHPISFSLYPEGKQEGSTVVEELNGVYVNEVEKYTLLDVAQTGLDVGTEIFAFCRRHEGMGFSIGWNDPELFPPELLEPFVGSEVASVIKNNNQTRDFILPVNYVGADGAIIDWGDGEVSVIPPYTRFSSSDFASMMDYGELASANDANALYKYRGYHKILDHGYLASDSSPEMYGQEYEYEFTLPAGTKSSAIFTKLAGYAAGKFELFEGSLQSARLPFTEYSVSLNDSDRMAQFEDLNSVLGNAVSTLKDHDGDLSINTSGKIYAYGTVGAEFEGLDNYGEVRKAYSINFDKTYSEDKTFVVRNTKGYARAWPVHRYPINSSYQISIRGDIEGFGVPSEHYAKLNELEISTQATQIGSIATSSLLREVKHASTGGEGFTADKIENLYEGAFSSAVTKILKFPQWANCEYIKTFKGSNIKTLDNKYLWSGMKRAINIFEDNNEVFELIEPNQWNFGQVDQFEDIFKSSKTANSILLDRIFFSKGLIDSFISLAENSGEAQIEIGIPKLKFYGDDKLCEYEWIDRLIDGTDNRIVRALGAPNQIFFDGPCHPRVSTLKSLEQAGVQAAFPAAGNGAEISNIAGFFKGELAIDSTYLTLLKDNIAKQGLAKIFTLDYAFENVNIDKSVDLSSSGFVNSMSLSGTFKGAQINNSVKLPEAAYFPLSLESSFENAAINHSSINDYLINLNSKRLPSQGFNLNNLFKNTNTSVDIDIESWEARGILNSEILFEFVDNSALNSENSLVNGKYKDFAFSDSSTGSINLPEIFSVLGEIKDWYWIKATAPSEPLASGFSKPNAYFYKQPTKKLYWGMPLKETGSVGYWPNYKTSVQFPANTANVDYSDISLDVAVNGIKASEYGLSGLGFPSGSLITNFSSGLKLKNISANENIVSFSGDQGDWTDLKKVFIAIEPGSTIFEPLQPVNSERVAVTIGVDEPIVGSIDYSKLIDNYGYSEFHIVNNTTAAQNGSDESSMGSSEQAIWNNDATLKKCTFSISLVESWIPSSNETNYVRFTTPKSYNAVDNDEVTCNVGDIGVILQVEKSIDSEDVFYIAKYVEGEDLVSRLPYIPIITGGAFSPYTKYIRVTRSELTSVFEFVKKSYSRSGAPAVDKTFFGYAKKEDGAVDVNTITEFVFTFGKRGSIDGKVDIAELNLDQEGWYAFYVDSYNLMSEGKGDWLALAPKDSATLANPLGVNESHYISDPNNNLVKIFPAGTNKNQSAYLNDQGREINSFTRGSARPASNQWVLVKNTGTTRNTILVDEANMLVPYYSPVEYGGDGVKIFQQNGLFNKQPLDSDFDGYTDNLDMDKDDPFFPLYTEVTITYRDSSLYSGISAEIQNLSFNPSENQVTVLLDLSDLPQQDFAANSIIDWGDGLSTEVTTANATASYVETVVLNNIRYYAFTHQYSSGGDKVVKIKGNFKKMFPEPQWYVDYARQGFGQGKFPEVLRSSIGQYITKWLASNFRIKSTKLRGGAGLESIGLIHGTYLPRDLFNSHSRQHIENSFLKQTGTVHPFHKDHSISTWLINKKIDDNNWIVDWVRLDGFQSVAPQGGIPSYLEVDNTTQLTDSAYSEGIWLTRELYGVSDTLYYQRDPSDPVSHFAGNLSGNVLDGTQWWEEAKSGTNTRINGFHIGSSDINYPLVGDAYKENNKKTWRYLKSLDNYEWSSMSNQSPRTTWENWGANLIGSGTTADTRTSLNDRSNDYKLKTSAFTLEENPSYKEIDAKIINAYGSRFVNLFNNWDTAGDYSLQSDPSGAVNYKNSTWENKWTIQELYDSNKSLIGLGKFLFVVSEDLRTARIYIIEKLPSASEDEQLSWNKKYGYSWAKFVTHFDLKHYKDFAGRGKNFQPTQPSLMDGIFTDSDGTKKYTGSKHEDFIEIVSITHQTSKQDYITEGNSYHQELLDVCDWWGNIVEFPKAIMENQFRNSNPDGSNLRFRIVVTIEPEDNFGTDTMATASWGGNDTAVAYLSAETGDNANRTGNMLPTGGWIKINEKFFQNGEFDEIDPTTGKSLFWSTIRHEITHCLGFGSEFLGPQFNKTMLIDKGDEGLFFNGTRGLNAYRQHLNWHLWKSVLGIPLENSGGSNTASGHLEEGSASSGDFASNNRTANGVFHPGLENEELTGYTEGSASGPLSAITLSILDDMGWYVKISQAEVLHLRIPYEFRKNRNVTGITTHDASNGHLDSAQVLFVDEFEGDWKEWMEDAPSLWRSSDSTINFNTKNGDFLDFSANPGPEALRISEFSTQTDDVPVWKMECSFEQAQKMFPNSGGVRWWNILSHETRNGNEKWNGIGQVASGSVNNCGMIVKFSKKGEALQRNEEETLLMNIDHGTVGMSYDALLPTHYAFAVAYDDNGFWGLTVKDSAFIASLYRKTWGPFDYDGYSETTFDDLKYFPYSERGWMWEVFDMSAETPSATHVNLALFGSSADFNPAAENFETNWVRGTNYDLLKLKSGITSLTAGPRYAGIQITEGKDSSGIYETFTFGSELKELSQFGTDEGFTLARYNSAVENSTYVLNEGFFGYIDTAKSSLLKLSNVSAPSLSFENYIEEIDLSEFYKHSINSDVLRNLFADVYADTLDFSSIDVTNGSNKLPWVRGARINNLKYFKVDDEFLDTEIYNHGSFVEDNGAFAADALLGQIGFLTSPDFLQAKHSDALMFTNGAYTGGKEPTGYLYKYEGSTYPADTLYIEDYDIPTFPADGIIDRAFIDSLSDDFTSLGKLSSSVQCPYAELQVGDYILYYADGSEIDMPAESNYTAVEWKELIAGSSPILSLSDLNAERTLGDGSFPYKIVRRLDPNWTWGFEDPRQGFTPDFNNGQLDSYGSYVGLTTPYWKAYNSQYYFYLTEEWANISSDEEMADWADYLVKCEDGTIDSVNHADYRPQTIKIPMDFAEIQNFSDQGLSFKIGTTGHTRAAKVSMGLNAFPKIYDDYITDGKIEILAEPTHTDWVPVLAKIESIDTDNITVKIVSNTYLKNGETQFTLSKDNYEDYTTADGYYKDFYPVAGRTWVRTLLNGVAIPEAFVDLPYDLENGGSYKSTNFDLLHEELSNANLEDLILMSSFGNSIDGSQLEYDLSNKKLRLKNSFEGFSYNEALQWATGNQTVRDIIASQWTPNSILSLLGSSYPAYTGQANRYMPLSYTEPYPLARYPRIEDPKTRNELVELSLVNKFLFRSSWEILQDVKETLTPADGGTAYSYFNLRKLSAAAGLSEKNFRRLIAYLFRVHGRRFPRLFDGPIDAVKNLDLSEFKSTVTANGLYGIDHLVESKTNEYGYYYNYGFGTTASFGRNNASINIENGGSFDISFIDHWPKWHGSAYGALRLGNYNITIIPGDIDNPELDKFTETFFPEFIDLNSYRSFSGYSSSSSASQIVVSPGQTHAEYLEALDLLSIPGATSRGYEVSVKNIDFWLSRNYVSDYINRHSPLNTAKQSMLQKFPCNLSEDPASFALESSYIYLSNTYSYDKQKQWPTVNKVLPDGAENLYWRKAYNDNIIRTNMGSSVFIDRRDQWRGLWPLGDYTSTGFVHPDFQIWY